ncbi:MAG: N-acetyl-alpha-D-glucosaminyl L-malate synthase [Gammaproteobacteria bacterium]|nr:N-acetyl-alpha-D-glucosaminyl L-malate synthase [Gammaproteobacteria bacterium]
MNDTIGVLHLVDSLALGGAEHMAVLLANNLPESRYRAYLCASRQAGALQDKIQPHVIFYNMRRKGRFDLLSVFRLAKFIRRENIGILHAHTTSLFLGVILCWMLPSLRLVWHDHFGEQGMRAHPVWLYRSFARRADIVFCVTRELADWSVHSLGLPVERVRYLPNFIETLPPITQIILPGEAGKRIVCVANIRLQKDHLTLLRALARVIQVDARAHLFLVGAETDPALAKQARQESLRLGLDAHVSWLGLRNDVPDLLEQCDIGVLSSISEGFPVALLEYGRAGLAVVSTQVGQAAEILENGRAGALVPRSDPEALAEQLIQMLQSPSVRRQFGERLQARVLREYGVESIVQRVCGIYETLI